MKSIFLSTTLICLGILQGCASGTIVGRNSASGDEEAFIAFADQRSAVTSWQADGRNGLWIEGGRGNWYYASFLSPCIGIDYAVRIGFDNGSSQRLDRFSRVVVPNEHQRCQIDKFSRSGAPPAGDKREFPEETVEPDAAGVSVSRLP